MLPSWSKSPKKGLHQEKEERWKDGSQMAWALHYHPRAGKRVLQARIMQQP